MGRLTVWRTSIFVLGVSPLASGCVFRHPIQAHTSSPQAHVETFAKAHLGDGQTVVYPHGFELDRASEIPGDPTEDSVFLVGAGDRFDIALRPAGEVTRLSLREVEATTTYTGGKVAWMRTLAMNGLGLGIFAAVMVATVDPLQR